MLATSQDVYILFQIFHTTAKNHEYSEEPILTNKGWFERGEGGGGNFGKQK